MSKMENFPYPTPIPAKICECSFWGRSVMLGSVETGKIGLISREIIFPEFQLYDHDTSTSQTDGRTGRQLALAIPRSAWHRAVKIARVISGVKYREYSNTRGSSTSHTVI